MSTSERIEQFKADVAEMKLKTGGANRETVLQAIGGLLMVAGVVVALVAYAASLNQDDQRDILSGVILSVSMLALAVVGAAVFVRYSIARFLRVWLLRQLYEGQAHVDQVVEALRQPEADRRP